MNQIRSMKWCYYHQRQEPIESFAANSNKQDGLQTECRAAQAERRGKVGKTVLRIGIGVAIAMALHSLFAGMLGIFAGVSGAMPWNWFSDASDVSDVSGDDDMFATGPSPLPQPEDIAPPPVMDDPGVYTIEPEQPSFIPPFVDDTFLEEDIIDAEPEPIQPPERIYDEQPEFKSPNFWG